MAKEVKPARDSYRTEHDPLGSKHVPATALWGIHTQRAWENFPISGYRAPRELIRALGQIKLAAAKANAKLGFLDAKIAKAIQDAAKEVIAGEWDEHFPIDVFQAGAGTPWNMNANEVIANRALELLHHRRGNYHVIHPNDHVNFGQSTNDVMPSAVRIAALTKLPELMHELHRLETVLRKHAREHARSTKSARTHLQDAVPITFGQVFEAWANAMAAAQESLVTASSRLHDLSIGGTAVGTGVNTAPGYDKLVVKELRALTKHPFSVAKDKIQLTQFHTDFLGIANALRVLAVDLTKICNDIRLLNSGPRTGLAELILPAVEPGSSIMPGKINPSMAEMLNMVCYQIVGNATTIEQCCAAGQLELNVMLPVTAHALLESLDIMTNGVGQFTDRCVVGLKVNTKRTAWYFKHSASLATLLAPSIGYDRAAAIAQEAVRTGKTIEQVVLDKKLMTKKEFDQLTDPKSSTQPNLKRGARRK